MIKTNTRGLKFKVEGKIFENINNAYFGVVIARNIDNAKFQDFIKDMLSESVNKVISEYSNTSIKEHPSINCYREAFRKVDINPNKFMCSIEALVTRVVKKGELPSINPLVDLGNALSLKYSIPIGLHDIDGFDGDIELRYTTKDDVFIPIGCSEKEVIDDNEISYVSGHDIKTRKWAWRQGDKGKITEYSKNIFIPLDGFTDINKKQIEDMQKELVEILENKFGADCIIGFVDKDNPEFNF